MITRQGGTSSGKGQPTATFPHRVAFTMGIYSERCARWARDLRCAMPGSKPFLTLRRRKEWKEFEKFVKDQNRAYVPGESVR
jgi:hypothetical protein